MVFELRAKHFALKPKSSGAVLALCLYVLMLQVGCKGSEVLAPQPSAQDLDHTSPTCPGLAAVTLASGPALSLVWGAASDDVTDAGDITYSVFMKVDSGNYNLASPSMIVTGQTSASLTLGISTGHVYTLWVACKDQAGNSYPAAPTGELSITVTDVTAPTAITDLAVSYPTFTTMLLTWSPANDSEAASTIVYKIYASTSASVSTTGTPLASVTGVTSYLSSSLSPNTTWYYRVKATDPHGNTSSSSNEASGTTVADTTSPSWTAGNALTAGTVTTTAIPLTWSAASDNVTATGSIVYKIYRCSGSISCNPFGGSGTLATTTAGGATSYSDTGLTPSMIYVYGIRAVDGSANISTNTDTLVTSTLYANSGDIYIYPTLTEPRIYQGADLAVANVVGTASGGTAYPDLIVGAPMASQAGSAYRQNGCVFIYSGTGSGTFATLPTQVICAPNVTSDGSANNFHFGYSIVAVDMDGDGVKDLVASYPALNIVYVYITQNNSGTLSLSTSPSASIPNASGGGYFGIGMCAGDLDGSGAADLAIVSPNEGTSNNGQVNIYVNTSTGGVFSVPSSTPATTASPRANVVAGGWTLAAGPSEQIVRRCAIGNFDANAPSNIQLILGSGQAGSAAGSQTDGLISFFEVTVGATPTLTYTNFVSGSTAVGTGSTQWGEALAAVQLNATATSSVKSLAVGAPADSSAGTTAGAVYLYNIAKVAANYTLTDSGRQWSGGRDLNANSFGSGLASAAIWGQTDGTTDLVVGSWLDDQSQSPGDVLDSGDIYTYRNINNSISTTVGQMGFDPSSKNASSNQQFGWAMCSGDVNNDGDLDMVVGSPNQSYDSTAALANLNNIGAIYIYYGTTSGEIDFSSPSQIIYGPGDQASGQFGSSCVVMDYNNDTKSDLVVGSQGRAVSGTTRGAVFVYFGSTSSALSSTYSDAILGPIAQNTAQFGSALASGDFDNNGYPDLAVGAMGINNSTPAYNAVGRVYLYFGTSSGIQTGASPAATAPKELAPPHGSTASAPVPSPLTPGVFGSNQHCGNGNFYTGGTRNIVNNSWNFGSAIAAYPTRAKVSGVLGIDLIICAQGATVVANEIQSGSNAVTNEGVCYIYEGTVNKNSSAASNPGEISTCATNEIRYDHAGSSSYTDQPYYFGSAITVGRWGGRANINDLVICARQGRDPDLSSNNVGGCLAYYGLNDGTGNMAGGFQQLSSNNPYQNNRKSPSASKYFYNGSTQVETSVTNQYSQFGQSVLILGVDNNGYENLFVGEPLSDSRIGIDGTAAPSTKGKDSGRIYMLRGGWPQ